MRTRVRQLGVSLLLGAMAMGGAPVTPDTVETSFRAAVGAGQYSYAHVGCSGVTYREAVPVSEAAFTVDRKGKSPVRVGVRGSYIWTQYGTGITTEDPLTGDTSTLRFFIDEEVLAAYPFVNYESERFAVGAGYLFTDGDLPWGTNRLDPPSPGGYLRIGKLGSVYVDASYLHGPAPLTDDYARVGIGLSPNPAANVWLGVGTGPRRNLGFSVGGDFRVKPEWSVNLRGRFGTYAGVPEMAVSTGLSYHWRQGD